ncbi:putative alpha-ketoglutarate-dependent sulfonate dioxygenase [Lachnellula arida]|uniref:Putative alpha-ketoglutarate-dependent sulfonate dioxygenase n=1 Tax=Lachnellula arida TaxID=1316785 RepID=A0A8T9B259_9HELO|nr:putative alpha-ketoglutarate-dependent sulfonate dioxygenase [Lachnellula arida]
MNTSPVVRTNPVTGWKHIFAAGQQIHDGKINGVTDREEEMMKQYFLQLITENHDLQCRFKWGVNDVVVWDNDYNGKRKLIRITSIGEKPYLDPNSLSRAQALKEDPLLQVVTPPAEPEEPRKRQRTA